MIHHILAAFFCILGFVCTTCCRAAPVEAAHLFVSMCWSIAGYTQPWVFDGDAHKVFREFFGTDNPFQGGVRGMRLRVWGEVLEMAQGIAEGLCTCV